MDKTSHDFSNQKIQEMEKTVKKSLPSMNVFINSYTPATSLTPVSTSWYSTTIASHSQTANSSLFNSQSSAVEMATTFSPSAFTGQINLNSTNKQNHANNVASQANCMDNASTSCFINNISDYKANGEIQPLENNQTSTEQMGEPYSLFDILNSQYVIDPEDSYSDSNSRENLLNLISTSQGYPSSNSSSTYGSGSDNGKLEGSSIVDSVSPKSSPNSKRMSYSREEAEPSNSFSHICLSEMTGLFRDVSHGEVQTTRNTSNVAHDTTLSTNRHLVANSENQMIGSGCQIKNVQMYFNQGDYNGSAMAYKPQSEQNTDEFTPPMMSSGPVPWQDRWSNEMKNSCDTGYPTSTAEMNCGSGGQSAMFLASPPSNLNESQENDGEDTNDDNEVADVMSGKLLVARQQGKNNDHSYIALISKAILSTPERRLLLSDIYKYISDHNPGINNNKAAWRNSVRHNLSLNECFVKQVRLGKGRGHYWTVHPACIEDFMKGNYRRRHARRRAKKCTLEYGNSFNNMFLPGQPCSNYIGGNGAPSSFDGNEHPDTMSHFPYNNANANANLCHLNMVLGQQHYNTVHESEAETNGSGFVLNTVPPPRGSTGCEVMGYGNGQFQNCDYITNRVPANGH